MIQVDVGCYVPHTFPVIAPDSDRSSKTAVDSVKGFTADVLGLDLPPDVESIRPDDRRRVYGEELGEVCAHVVTAEDGENQKRCRYRLHA